MTTPVDYDSYIRSPEWRSKRQEYFSSKMPQGCAVCGYEGPGLHLHHRSYRRLGNERLHDLIPLCQEHHSAVHAAHDARTNPQQGLWQTTKRTVRRLRQPE